MQKVLQPQEVDLGKHGHFHEVQSSHEVVHLGYQIDQHSNRNDSASSSSGFRREILSLLFTLRPPGWQGIVEAIVVVIFFSLLQSKF